MITVNTPGSWGHMYPFLLHAKWDGCQLADFVFPFFLFAIGLSMSVSSNKDSHASQLHLFWKLLKRSALIFAVGFLLNWFPFYHKNILDVRVFGVLQRIAMSYFVAGLWLLIFPKAKHHWLMPFAGCLLLVYWALSAWMGDFTLEGNLNNVIDQWLVSAKNLYHGFGIAFDPEGFLGAISSSAQILIAYCLGAMLLKHKTDLPTFLKSGLIWGVAMCITGWVWSFYYPINKPLWSSSYVLWSSGVASLFFVALVFITDYKKLNAWTLPFKVFGMNPLFSFLLSIVLVKVMIYLIKIDGVSLYAVLYKQLFQPAFGDKLGSLFFSFAMVGVVYLAAYLLYRKRIVVKL